MTKDDIINKLQAQGLRWIESERDARSEPALDAVQRRVTTLTLNMKAKMYRQLGAPPLSAQGAKNEP